jgi:hypothetical protein
MLTALRILLLVLAMGLQTIAGGAALARAAAVSPEETFSAQCHSLRAGEQCAPDDRSAHRHNCQACLLCGHPPAAWVSLTLEIVTAGGEYALIDAPTLAARPLFGRSSRAHSARGPPLSRS